MDAFLLFLLATVMFGEKMGVLGGKGVCVLSISSEEVLSLGVLLSIMEMARFSSEANVSSLFGC
jgi:hypothetical protein